MGPVSSVKRAAPQAAVRKSEDPVSTVLRAQGIVTVHDQVVSLVAQRWAKAFHCKVTIHTSLEQNPWADPQQRCDIVGWQVTSSGNTMAWMAEVETGDSLRDAETVSGWKKAVVRGIPFYLVVPRGLKESVQKLAADAFVPFSGIYEYTFVNDLCQVL
jgi:hypothetical protein